MYQYIEIPTEGILTEENTYLDLFNLIAQKLNENIDIDNFNFTVKEFTDYQNKNYLIIPFPKISDDNILDENTYFGLMVMISFTTTLNYGYYLQFAKIINDSKRVINLGNNGYLTTKNNKTKFLAGSCFKLNSKILCSFNFDFLKNNNFYSFAFGVLEKTDDIQFSSYIPIYQYFIIEFNNKINNKKIDIFLDIGYNSNRLPYTKLDNIITYSDTIETKRMSDSTNFFGYFFPYQELYFLKIGHYKSKNIYILNSQSNPRVNIYDESNSYYLNDYTDWYKENGYLYYKNFQNDSVINYLNKKFYHFYNCIAKSKTSFDPEAVHLLVEIKNDE